MSYEEDDEEFDLFWILIWIRRGNSSPRQRHGDEVGAVGAVDIVHAVHAVDIVHAVHSVHSVHSVQSVHSVHSGNSQENPNQNPKKGFGGRQGTNFRIWRCVLDVRTWIYPNKEVLGLGNPRNDPKYLFWGSRGSGPYGPILWAYPKPIKWPNTMVIN